MPQEGQVLFFSHKKFLLVSLGERPLGFDSSPSL